MPHWTGLRAAESALLARRRDQTGAPTYGDDADRALLAALAELPAEEAAAAHACGHRVGAAVYARRFVEDSLPKAVDLLAGCLLASGLGTLSLQQSFHRSARLSFEPATGAGPALRSFAAGVVAGFFSEAFNCEARATSAGATIALELGPGRDVNRKEALA